MKKSRVFQSIEELKLSHLPDKCPICNVSLNPSFIVGYIFERTIGEYIRLVFSCTSHKCLELFIAAYSKDDSNFYDDMFYYRGSAPYKAHPVQFETTILEISESFSEIYNQAKEAEDRGLDQICGVGYRKALEFLIKDYAILINPENEEQIKREFLNGVITNYIHNEKIKEISKRAVWIGNDETHYIRKWDNKDINDLKILIKLTTNWITNEVLSNKYIEEMN